MDADEKELTEPRRAVRSTSYSCTVYIDRIERIDTDEQDYREAIETAFPELDRIEGDDLREGVFNAWAAAMADNEVTDLGAFRGFPGPAGFGPLNGYLVSHVRDVTGGALALFENPTEQRVPDVSIDLLVVGALVHDVSKLYEFDGMASTAVERLLGHPYYGVPASAASGNSERVSQATHSTSS